MKMVSIVEVFRDGIPTRVSGGIDYLQGMPNIISYSNFHPERLDVIRIHNIRGAIYH